MTKLRKMLNKKIKTRLLKWKEIKKNRKKNRNQLSKNHKKNRKMEKEKNNQKNLSLKNLRNLNNSNKNRSKITGNNNKNKLLVIKLIINKIYLNNLPIPSILTKAEPKENNKNSKTNSNNF